MNSYSFIQKILFQGGLNIIKTRYSHSLHTTIFYAIIVLLQQYRYSNNYIHVRYKYEIM